MATIQKKGHPFLEICINLLVDLWALVTLRACQDSRSTNTYYIHVVLVIYEEAALLQSRPRVIAGSFGTEKRSEITTMRLIMKVMIGSRQTHA